MPKKISDEKLIDALIETGSVSAAAAKCGLSRSAVHKRLTPEMREKINEAQDEAIVSASTGLTAALDIAIQALVDVARSPLSAAGLRVAASDAILRHALRYNEVANILKRLDALEASQNDE